MTPLTKPVTRSLDAINRGRRLVTRITPEGVYTKGQGERWSSAYLVPWNAVDDLGARLLARRRKEEKRLRKKGGARV